jgi:hypothetical protein
VAQVFQDLVGIVLALEGGIFTQDVDPKVFVGLAGASKVAFGHAWLLSHQSRVDSPGLPGLCKGSSNNNGAKTVMGEDQSHRPAPPLLTMTVYPTGPGQPHERWQVTTGDVLVGGTTFPIDQDIVREACAAYHKRIDKEANGA